MNIARIALGMAAAAILSVSSAEAQGGQIQAGVCRAVTCPCTQEQLDRGMVDTPQGCKDDCSNFADDLARLVGQMRRLREAADLTRRALQEADSRRYAALDGIYGSRGSAVAFIEGFVNAVPANKGKWGKAVGWAKRAAAAVFEGDPHVDQIATSMAEDKLKTGLGDAFFKQASRDARAYYESTGNPSAATRQFLSEAQAGREAIKAIDVLRSLKGLHDAGNRLGEGINDWVEAKRDHDNLQREIAAIDARIDDLQRQINALRAACEEEDEDPGFPVGFLRRHWPGAPALAAAAGRLLAGLAPSPAYAAVRTGRDSQATTPRHPEPDMAAMLRALAQLASLDTELPRLSDRLVDDALLPLAPFWIAGWDELPPPVQADMLNRAVAGLEPALRDLDRVEDLSLRVIANLGLGVTQGPVADEIAALRAETGMRLPSDLRMLGPIGAGAREVVPVLLSVLADPGLDAPAREAARTSLVRIGAALGTGLQVVVDSGMPAPHSWSIVPAGADPAGYVASHRRAEGGLQSLPPGSYDIYWAQEAAHRDRPLLLAGAVTVDDAEPGPLHLSPALRLERADWVTPLDGGGWWGVVPAGDAPSERASWTRAHDALALPPGHYDVYWVQGHAQRDHPMLLAPGLEVAAGRPTVIPAAAGMRLTFGGEAPTLPSSGWWGAVPAGGDPADRVNWSAGRLDLPILLPPGSYDVYWVATHGAEPALKAAGVSVGASSLVLIDWETGRTRSVAGAGSAAAATPPAWRGLALILAGALGVLGAGGVLVVRLRSRLRPGVM